MRWLLYREQHAEYFCRHCVQMNMHGIPAGCPDTCTHSAQHFVQYVFFNLHREKDFFTIHSLGFFEHYRRHAEVVVACATLNFVPHVRTQMYVDIISFVCVLSNSCFRLVWNRDVNIDESFSCETMWLAS